METGSKSSAAGLSSLDRRAMEVARLARSHRKRPATEETMRDDEPPRSSKHHRVGARPSSDSRISPPLLDGKGTNANVPYPLGVFKSTWCFGYPRDNDIKLEEVLQKDTLKVAVMSSWQMDFEWLSSKIDLSKTKLLLVMQSKDENEQAQWREQGRSWSQSIRLCFPPMAPGIGTMHSKLMLLFHQNYLRIVIPSANLVAFDWGETGELENVVFLIDLPRLVDASPELSKMNMIPKFGRDLLSFLKATGIDSSVTDQQETVTEALLKFDFSNTNHIAFVHTIAGAHLGSDAQKTGFPQLSAAVCALDMNTEDSIKVDYAASSIGAINEQRLKSMYDALKGQTIIPFAPVSTERKSQSISDAPSKLDMSSLFHVYYPTADTVHSSKGGANAAGTLFMTPIFDKPTSSGAFPFTSLRDSKSARAGLLSHAKMIIARGRSHALVYVGSANFSPSAWGTLTWDKKVKKAKLTANNWESGILMKVPARTEGNGHDGTETNAPIVGNIIPLEELKDLAGQRIPIPFCIPGSSYVDGKGSTKRPWIQNIAR